MRHKHLSAKIVFAAVAAIAICSSALAMPDQFSGWSQASRVEATGADPAFNGPSLDGCPFISRDDKTFYMASNRPGGFGGIDIWVSTRANADAEWGAPVNVGAPVNSAANDFCPTISRDSHLFYLVSNRANGCGGDDIYMTRLRADGWDPVANLGCDVNSTGNEASPFPLPESADGPVLYFSSTKAGSADLYVSESHGGVFSAAAPISELNTTAQDGQPNVRRDGLEIFFFSNRPGAAGNDIYAATRASTRDPWSTPVNLGTSVNSGASETRPSLSWDGTTLYFGSTRTGNGAEGDSDHYVATRERLAGN
jgi:Tol biopolymer transport system component